MGSNLESKPDFAKLAIGKISKDGLFYKAESGLNVFQKFLIRLGVKRTKKFFAQPQDLEGMVIESYSNFQHYFRGRHIYNTDDFLRSFVKKGFSQESVGPYFVAAEKKLKESKLFLGNYYDGQYSFIFLYGIKSAVDFLTSYKKKLVRAAACISFNLDLSGRTSADIVQIQGVKGAEECLKPIKWERMLVSLVCRWAEMHGFNQATILPYHRNLWRKVSQYPSGKIRYDVTARRCGFRYDQRKELYVKALT